MTASWRDSIADDTGTRMVGRTVVALMLWRVGGPAICLLAARLFVDGPPLTGGLFGLVALVVLANVGFLLVLQQPELRRRVLSLPAVAVVDIVAAFGLNLMVVVFLPHQTALLAWTDPFSQYLIAASALWVIVYGRRLAVVLAAAGLVMHWGVALLNGYGWPSFWQVRPYERWIWLALALCAVSVAASAVREGVATEMGERAALARAIRAEAEAQILRDAHGGVLPTLAGIRHLAVRLPEHNERAQILALARGCETAVRRRLAAWTGDAGGLRRGIEDEVEEVRFRLELAGRVDPRLEVVFPDEELALSAPSCAALVEAVGEAIRNAVRHAAATHVVVRVRVSAAEVTVVVRDDGVGWSGRARGFGVRQSIEGPVRAAGGSARVETATGRGCRWELRMPLGLGRFADGGVGGAAAL